MLRWLLALAMVFCLSVSAAGQTTRPAPQGWTRAVSDFATDVTTGNVQDAQALVADQADIHGFNTEQSTPLKAVSDFAAGQTFLGAHAYVHPPVTMAADLAADAAASSAVPAEAKQSLADEGPAAAKASDIAVKWVASTLDADNGTLVGVISFWNPHATGTADNPVHPLFILIKGEKNDAGKFVITKIVFGDPISGNAE